VTESTSPTATLFQSSTGLFIVIDETDYRLRRRRLVCEVTDPGVIVAISSLEASVIERERAGGGR